MDRCDGGPAFPRAGHYPLDMGTLPPGELADAILTMNKPQRGMSYQQYLTAHVAAGVLASYAGADCSLPRSDVFSKLVLGYVGALMAELGLVFSVQHSGGTNEDR